MSETRRQIIHNAKNVRAEIEQIFIDAAAWNDESKARKEGADPIDPDPDGSLRRTADGIDRMLLNEARLVVEGKIRPWD